MSTAIADALRSDLNDPAHVADALGLERSRIEKAKWACPYHGGTSLSLRCGRDGTLQVRCFGCDEVHGDVFTLVAYARGLHPRRNFREVLLETAKLANRYDLIDELERGPSAPRPAPPPRPIRPPQAPEYPPCAEVVETWERAAHACDDADVSRWLESRGLDPHRITDFSVARALVQKDVPAWAALGRRPWPDAGYRLIVPAYDANGSMRSLRARALSPDVPVKEVAASGFTSAGLILGEGSATAMLRGESAPDRVLVAEGVPDFLTWATRFSDAEELPPAVMGVFSGSWTAEMAARVPAGARVAVRTHDDAAGRGYANRVAESLGEKCNVTMRAA